MNIPEIVNCQRTFFATGATRDVNFRLEQLRKLRYALERYEPQLLDALWQDLHKSEREAFLTEMSIVYGEINYALKHLKKWAKRKRVAPELKVLPSRSYIQYEPLGVSLIIAPWNYPVNLLFAPLVGAIAAGCTAVLKSSPYTPTVDSVMREMVENTFAPEYIAYTQGGREVNTALLAEHWDMIFYTGSPAVGRVVMQAAAKNLTPCVLELGGKSPCIVDKTADIDVAARRIVWGKCINAGQTCIAPDYMFVHHDIKEALLDRMRHYIKEFFGENPEESDYLCRIVSDKAMNRLLGLLEDFERSEKFSTLNSQLSTLYIEPTLLDGVTPNHPIMQEEIFGPILPVMEFSDIREVEQYVNSHEKPLAFYYFGRERDGWALINRTTSGGACINDVLMHISNSNLPFGGVGNSGMGKYHRYESFLAFSNRRAVLATPTWFDLPVKFPPFKGLGLLKGFLK